MSEKEFQFEDGSLARFTVDSGSLYFYIQAKHLGKEVKVTSTTVTLTPEETSDLFSWLKNKLEESNG